MIQQKITEIAEILGWSVDFSEPQNGKTDVNFAKYTSYGQDFNFSVELEDDDMEAFIDNIHEYYENFDVDEEAYIWIGSDGHGKNGAPYHIADIVLLHIFKSVVCLYRNLRKNHANNSFLRRKSIFSVENYRFIHPLYAE